MAKIFLFIALIVSLAISCISAAELEIKVGTADGKNAFDPATLNVNTNDVVTFTWVSGKHSVVRSDAAADCTKSASVNALDSGVLTTGTFKYTVAETSGKVWFFCSVGTHCSVGKMYGTLVVGGNSTDAPPETPKSSGFKINSNAAIAVPMAVVGAIGLLL